MKAYWPWAVILAGFLAVGYLQWKERGMYSCITDWECMQFCPKHEADCDGGPQ